MVRLRRAFDGSRKSHSGHRQAASAQSGIDAVPEVRGDDHFGSILSSLSARGTCLVIGEPIPAPTGEDGKRPPRRAIRETTALLRERIQALFDDAQARVGKPNPPRPTSA